MDACEEVGERVQGALGHRPGRDASIREQGPLGNDGIVDEDLDQAQCLRRPRWARDRAGIDDPRGDGAGAFDRERRGDRGRDTEADQRIRSAEKDLCFGKNFPGANSDNMRKDWYPPVEERACLGGALELAVGAVDDCDEPPSVADRRSDEAVAQFLREARLHAVCADVHSEQRLRFRWVMPFQVNSRSLYIA